MTSSRATPAFTGSPARLAGDAHEARERLNHDVVARTTCGVGHFLAERGQRTGDQSGCSSTEIFQGEAELGHQSRTEVLDQHVGAAGEVPDCVDAVGRLEIDRDRALVPVQRQVVGGVVLHERWSPVAGVITVAGALDLDHVGAQIAQDLGRERSREHPRKVEDPEAGQREVLHGAEDTRPLSRSIPVCFHTTGASRRQWAESVCERAEPRARQCLPRRRRRSHRQGRIAGSYASRAWQGIGLPRPTVDRPRSARSRRQAATGARGWVLPAPRLVPGCRGRAGDDRAQKQALPETPRRHERRAAWRPRVLGPGQGDGRSVGRAGPERSRSSARS